jgi:uncharacterized membrane protein YkoI
MFRTGSALFEYSAGMRLQPFLRNIAMAAAGFAVLAATAESAQARPGWRDRGMGESFDASRPGEVVRERHRVPLKEVVRSIMARRGGQFLDAEIVGGGPRGGECYVIKWVTDDGRRIDYLVDAESGAILDQRGE